MNEDWLIDTHIAAPHEGHVSPLGNVKEPLAFRPLTAWENEVLSEGMLFCIQSMISKYFMAVSKHFDLEYSKLDADMKLEVIDPLELKGFRMKLIMEGEAYLFAKQTFKNEIL